jgi:hypothetical protein
MRIVLCGYMIRHPVAGNMMAYFQYVLGLHRLGHTVCYLEESGWPNSCYNPLSGDYGESPDSGIEKVGDLLKRYGLNIPVIYADRDSGRISSNMEETKWMDLKRILSGADLLINLGGVCCLPEFKLCRRRVFIDMDPFFTQTGLFGYKENLYSYHFYFSYGVGIGRSDCSVPTGDIDWRPTVPPVVMEIWQRPYQNGISPCIRNDVNRPFTTIANWSAYGSVLYRGRRYGQKNEEFLRMKDLPAKTEQKLELALSGAGSDIWSLLNQSGWHLRDAGEISIKMRTYLSYIIASRGEFSVAKNAYVITRSGWFSDRSVCYLAAGKPVIVQDTGFCDWLPSKAGIMPFSTVEEAISCIDSVNANYDAHSLAAWQTARNNFDHRIVLNRLVETSCERKKSSI